MKLEIFMYHPTTRVLTVLELLQANGRMSGNALAERLEVDKRTVRRYIVMLQDMGVPIEAERGRDGYYQLAKGFKLPPMMFTSGEALALALGLQVIRHIGMNNSPASIEGAWAKLNRVLPAEIGMQVDGLMQALTIELGVDKPPHADESLLTVFSTAIQRGYQVNIGYQAFSGEMSQRAINPYRVVYRSAWWYVVGFCNLRGDIRVFRLDRIRSAEMTTIPFPPPPADFDALALIEAGLARTPGIYKAEVEFFAPIADMSVLIPKSFGELIPTENGSLFTCFIQKLGWFAGHIAGLGVPFVIHSPQALCDELATMRQRVNNALQLPHP
jgi:predicted DNA-binding transcriptional regulator YafY